MPTIAYTDGACSGNPGPGGWAWAATDGRWASGASPATTNQRMEIMAAFEAVRSLPGELEVVSDSTYVVNCFRDGWWKGWLRRGWLNSKKEPVANRDLWEPFIALVRERDDVTFRWVKGHGGDPMNDLVDRLADTAGTLQQGGSGDTHPDPASMQADIVAASPARAAVTAGARRDRRLPDLPIAEHGVVVLGHRPPELGGYEANPVADAVRAKLAEILAARRQLDPELVVVSGLRLGAEQLGAEAAVEIGAPLVAVLPYPDADAPWPAASRARFAELRRAAAAEVVLEGKIPDTKQKAGAALARRDAWLARNVASAILVWDGRDAALRRLARSLEDHLGDEVWILDPTELVPPT
ncbi:MAG TPA: ribonuclease H [Acidimicrobiales bacterium]|nr:ribonuclease H [Acidimicrobiales bacterium]